MRISAGSERRAWSARGWAPVLVLATLLGGAQAGAAQAGRGDASLPPEAPKVADVQTASRFLAAHGRRGLIDGYSSGGLDVWIYPFQVLRDYRVSFRSQGAVAFVDGRSILSRVRYEADGVTRVYVGPDFVVRERLTAPSDKPAAILSYAVQSARPIEILVEATPVLDLMWPAALGGQSTRWDEAAGAYLLTEPLNGISAAVGSAETVGHDTPGNTAGPAEESPAVNLILRPDAAGTARVVVALNPPHTADPGALLHQTIREADAIVKENAAHAVEFAQQVVAVETPDEEVNRALAASETALDQAWVCNADLGCGFVAGYGPTRPGRRPQYDWFFAGDGLVAAAGALSAGDWKHAREELEFILRYQDKKTGMIWHELSQSAGFLDWVGKYPYMFVHVDVSFQFLAAAGHYVRTTGDVAFAREHWEQIAAAYAYCRAQLDPATALPRIPADKEGGNEQDKLADDLGLSTGWIAAAETMADLAGLTQHPELAADATKAAEQARASIGARYWDASQSFWISGHTATGRPAAGHRSGPPEAILMHAFSAPQREAVLDELASARFQTDWGTRSMAEGSPGYDPASYAAGSVWPVSTGALAQAFWSEGRPLTALGLWRALAPLAALDSPGHMPEVLAGDRFHPQAESVPEQTWSSAGFVSTTIEGLLGLKADGVEKSLRFAPHLPASWHDLTIRNLRIQTGAVSLILHRAGQSIQLRIRNEGEAFRMEFVPDLPLGAEHLRALFNGAHATGTELRQPEQTLAEVKVDVPHGESTLELAFDGGIWASVEAARPRLGDYSSGIRVVRLALDRDQLILDADVPAVCDSHLILESAWRLKHAEGARLDQIAPGRMELSFPAAQEDSVKWRRVHAVVQAERRER